MNQNHVTDLLQAVQAGEVRSIQFITPAVSTMIAAYVQTNRACGSRIRFDDNAKGYAVNLGLRDVLDGQYQPPSRAGGLQGVTYAKLTRLKSHSEVDHCNSIVNDLLLAQLANDDRQVVQLLVKVIGELHDNVASHANGFGFSSAQMYRGSKINFAIADMGRGMLSNVRMIRPSIECDSDAIQWCMKEGNTTSKPDDFLAQRLPEDSICNPYPTGTPITRVENHHIGLGLWHLMELVTMFRGRLSVLSGHGSFEFSPNSCQPKIKEHSFRWPGVAIEFQITVPRDGRPAMASEGDFDDLAKRLGL